jgi:hypothetical protein
MTNAAGFEQRLFGAAQQGRQVCGPCNNLCHRFCEGANCECLCRELRDESENKKRKQTKYKAEAGLSRDQAEFQF